MSDDIHIVTGTNAVHYELATWYCGWYPTVEQCHAHIMALSPLVFECRVELPGTPEVGDDAAWAKYERAMKRWVKKWRALLAPYGENPENVSDYYHESITYGVTTVNAGGVA